MREKTRDILNQNLEITEIKRDFPTYKLGEEYLEDVEGLDNPGVKASQIAHATREHLHDRESRTRGTSDSVTASPPSSSAGNTRGSVTRRPSTHSSQLRRRSSTLNVRLMLGRWLMRSSPSTRI